MSLPAAASERLLGATWRAVAIQGAAADGAARPAISIAQGGKVAGTGGCNRLFGTAAIDGSAMSFGAIGTTRMACPPPVMAQERRFLDALAATRSFRFDGAQLVFQGAAGAETVRFGRAP